MTITNEDIEASKIALSKIAILKAKMQDIIEKSEKQIATKREAIHNIEIERDSVLVNIQARINTEEESIKTLIANV